MSTDITARFFFIHLRPTTHPPPFPCRSACSMTVATATKSSVWQPLQQTKKKDSTQNSLALTRRHRTLRTTRNFNAKHNPPYNHPRSVPFCLFCGCCDSNKKSSVLHIYCSIIK